MNNEVINEIDALQEIVDDAIKKFDENIMPLGITDEEIKESGDFDECAN